MKEYFAARLGEHSTQVALGADITAACAALQGTMTWQNALAVLLGSLIPIFLPASK